uniref:Uncharacterized protein n=1 Tax=Lotharella oceanica TaxID=641309 RepID=A0A7S2TMN4_9EUKA
MKKKKIRDALREELVVLQTKAGFTGNDALVSDFEKRKMTNVALTKKLEDLKKKHGRLLASARRYKEEAASLQATGKLPRRRDANSGDLKI